MHICGWVERWIDKLQCIYCIVMIAMFIKCCWKLTTYTHNLYKSMPSFSVWNIDAVYCMEFRTRLHSSWQVSQPLALTVQHRILSYTTNRMNMTSVQSGRVRFSFFFFLLLLANSFKSYRNTKREGEEGSKWIGQVETAVLISYIKGLNSWDLQRKHNPL